MEKTANTICPECNQAVQGGLKSVHNCVISTHMHDFRHEYRRDADGSEYDICSCKKEKKRCA